MISENTMPYFLEVLCGVYDYDQKNGTHLMQEFLDALKYAHTFGDREVTGKACARLVPDFAKWSFLVNVERKVNSPQQYAPWVTMGMIFHPGRDVPDDSGSVELEPTSEPHWTFHS